MKILIVNGSPRKNGNTSLAVHALYEGITENLSDADCQIRNVRDLQISPCVNCDGCKKNNVCVMPDQSAELMQNVYVAHVVIFVTPIYWCGMTAQLKMVIDKFYSKDVLFRKQKKALAVISIGGESKLDSVQYRLIHEQFGAICAYLGWNVALSESFSAGEAGELSQNVAALSVLKNAWKKLQF